MLSLSPGATGFHLPGETPVYPPRVLLALPRGSEAWNLITGQLTCNEHLPCLGFFYFQKSPLLSTMGKEDIWVFFSHVAIFSLDFLIWGRTHSRGRESQT